MIFAVRNKEKALRAIPAEAMSKAVVMVVDLASLESVESFAAGLKQVGPIHRLVLNAGISDYTTKGSRKTRDGLDEIWQVNFLAHFYLTLLVKPILAPGARIVALTSFMHWVGDVNRFVDLVREPSNERAYMSYYSDSKLAMAIFASELNRRSFPLALAVNPGAVFSDIFQSWFFGWIGQLLRFLFGVLFLATSDGAKTSVLACTSSKLSSFTYLSPYGQIRGWGKLVARMTDMYWFYAVKDDARMIGECSEAVECKSNGELLWSLATEALGKTDPRRKLVIEQL